MADSPSKTPVINDPNAAQEAQKYDNPVPSREALLAFLDQADRPMTHEEVCQALAETDEERVEALRRRLIAMCRDGQLMSNRRNQFFPLEKADLIVGKVMGHKDGFGFVLRDGDDDIFLSNRQMRKVFHGDKVAVQIMGHDRRGRPEGKIVQVIERNTRQIVGRYYDQSGMGVVQPDNKRIPLEVLIAPENRNKAEHGQFVVVDITQQPNPGSMPLGRVVEVLGEHLAPGMEIEVAIRSHDIPNEWGEGVQEETDAIPFEVAEADKVNRIDLRHLPFVTIDGEDARDFDDAVYCEKNKSTGGWRLYVAIADVSHYVKAGSELDKEGHKRGNSVYFPGFVVPMLPEKLSNGLCSLNPNVDRLVMVCEMTISKAGNISGYKFQEGIIHSHARLTYNKVWSMIQTPITDAGQQWRDHYGELVTYIDNLYELFKLLRGKREERGAMDFDSVETRIQFDAERKIQEIVPTERNDAHMLIEECMLAANVCTAKFLQKYEVPCLYRVHAGPSADKLENLRAFLGEMGLSVNTGKRDPHPKDYQILLEQIADRPDSHLIQTVLLRSLSQAVYQPDNEGHFGLAYQAYTHFTSPIRRYPDLLVHRAIRSVIRSEQECTNCVRVETAKPLPKSEIYPYDMAKIIELGEHCSMTERRADDATRDVTDFLKCEYIRDRVGEVFEGVISAVTGFGLFVELKDVYVEGLVHVSSLGNDYYHFDAVKHRMTGERTSRSFRLGDSLWVMVTAVDLDERKIDFELATAPTNSGRQSMPEPARVPRKRVATAKGVEEQPLKVGNKPKNRTKKPRLNADVGKAVDPMTGELVDVVPAEDRPFGPKKSGSGKRKPAKKGGKKPFGKKPSGNADSSESAPKSDKKKPSKRQKLNAKKNAKKKAAKKAKKV